MVMTINLSMEVLRGLVEGGGFASVWWLDSLRQISQQDWNRNELVAMRRAIRRRPALGLSQLLMLPHIVGHQRE